MVSRTNLMGFSTSTTVSNFTWNAGGDTLTNLAAGYFYIDAGYNYYAISNDTMKIMVQTNGVLAANLIAYSDYSAALGGGAFGTNFVKVSGIVYLPANCYVRVYSDWAESTAQTVQLYLGYINAFAVNLGSIGGTGSGTVDPTNVVLANIIGTGALTNAGSSNRLMLTADSTRTTNTFKRYYFDTNQAPILSNLVAACVSGDIAELGAGDFRIGVQTIRVPVGVTLKGQGAKRTFIIGDVGVATNSIVQIMSTNTIEDLSILANKKANYFQYPIGNNMIFGHPAATNVTLRRVHLDGETDCLLISQSNRVSITIENCEFSSAWDVCNLIDLDTGDGVPGVTATIRDSILYSDSATAQLPASIADPKSQPLIVSGALVDLITSVVTATNHKAISLSMQGFETNLVYITDTIFRSAGTNGYGKQIDISTDSDVSVSKAVVSSQRIQDSDINGAAGVTYAPVQFGSTRVGQLHLTTGLASNSFLYLNASTNVAAGTFGSGLTFSGGTLTASGGGSGGTNFPNVNLLVGGTNLTLSAGVRKAYHNQTNGSHGINLNLAVPESGYEVTYSVSNSSSSDITVTFYTNSVQANPYDIATKTNVNTFTVSASAITKLKLTYAANGMWLLDHVTAPVAVLKFGSGITATTNGVNGLDVTISASGGTYLSFLGDWWANNISSNVVGGTFTTNKMNIGGGSGITGGAINPQARSIPYGGKIRGIIANCGGTVSSGSVTFEVFTNDISTGVACTLSSPQYTNASANITFVAGSFVDVRYYATTNFGPSASLEVSAQIIIENSP